MNSCAHWRVHIGWEQLCALACSHWLGTVVNSCAHWRVHIGWEQLCALACSHWLGTVVNSCAPWRVHKRAFTTSCSHLLRAVAMHCGSCE